MISLNIYPPDSNAWNRPEARPAFTEHNSILSKEEREIQTSINNNSNLMTISHNITNYSNKYRVSKDDDKEHKLIHRLRLAIKQKILSEDNFAVILRMLKERILNDLISGDKGNDKKESFLNKQIYNLSEIVIKMIELGNGCLSTGYEYCMANIHTFNYSIFKEEGDTSFSSFRTDFKEQNNQRQKALSKDNELSIMLKVDMITFSDTIIKDLLKKMRDKQKFNESKLIISNIIDRSISHINTCYIDDIKHLVKNDIVFYVYHLIRITCNKSKQTLKPPIPTNIRNNTKLNMRMCKR